MAAALAVAASVAAGAVPVSAATQADAWAQALRLNLLHGLATVNISSSPTSASNDGTQPDDPVTNEPAVALLDNATWLTAGALAETATARQDGISFACSGVVQSGATVVIGASEDACSSTGSGAGGVTVDLNALPGVGSVLDPLAGVEVSFDSITAFARAEPDGTAFGSSELVDAVAHIDVGGGLGVIDLSLGVRPDPNQDLLELIADAIDDHVATLDPVLDGALILLLQSVETAVRSTLDPIVSVLLNYQTTTGGELQVTAMRIALLDEPDATALLATAAAGPNQVTGLAVEKSATVEDVNANELVDSGDVITYTFLVTNTGSVTISTLELDDSMLAAAGVTVNCAATSLAAGAQSTCTADYTITADDVASGSVMNEATAAGTDPDGEPVESLPDDVTIDTRAPIPSPTPTDEPPDDSSKHASGTPDLPDTAADRAGSPALIAIVILLLTTAAVALAVRQVVPTAVETASQPREIPPA